jgi:tetrapyrrole methylase family protein/MazG family protein
VELIAVSSILSQTTLWVNRIHSVKYQCGPGLKPRIFSDGGEDKMPQGSLTILGLGPGSWDDLTIAAQQVLANASEVTFRTLRHPTITTLKEKFPQIAIASFDHLYESATDWGNLYQTMAQQLIDAALSDKTVIYAVPGHPLIGEASVRQIRIFADQHQIPVRIIGGVSFLEPICATLGIDPIAQGLQIIDATDLVIYQPQEIAGIITTNRPVLIAQVYNRRMVSIAKIALQEIWPSDWSVTLIKSAGLTDEHVRTMPLSEIDHDEFADHLTSLYISPIPVESLRNLRTPEGLRYIVARLRGPEGCPWDRKQTHATLARYALEEAAEVADAIDEFEDDPLHLAEELGDLLLQVYLHAEIAQEEEVFTIGDIIEAITTKLIRRHPHVFGDVSVSGADQVVQNWENIKRAERETTGEVAPFESLMRGITRHGAALTNAHEIQRKAIKTGFDWPTIQDWVTQLNNEVEELQSAPDDAARHDEFGDLLFSLVALARRFGLDAEEALRSANEKFRHRFMRMEELCHEQGFSLDQLDRDKQRELWLEVKEDKKVTS